MVASRLGSHINVWDLQAIHLACLAFLPHIKGEIVQVLTDNMVAMFYMNRQGGTRSDHCCQEAIHLCEFCISSAIHLKVVPPSKCSKQLGRLPEQLVQWRLSCLSGQMLRLISPTLSRPEKQGGGSSYRLICYLSQQQVLTLLFWGRLQSGAV